MIVTHAMNGQGMSRIYLGGRSSIECWIEPKADRIGWSFHLEDSFCGNRLDDTDKKQWAAYTLMELADALDVAPADLHTVPFESIAALHTADPFASRRIAASRRPNMDFAYVSTAPHMSKPAAGSRASDYARNRPNR
jgi:hypothetical protein